MANWCTEEHQPKGWLEVDLAEYRSRCGGDPAGTPGWDAIDASLRKVHGSQEPKHWGTVVKYMLGGPDPLDGCSSYLSTDGPVPHWHYCSFGFSELYYNEEAVGQEFSGLGYELTFRLARNGSLAEPPVWVFSLMQNIARYAFNTDKPIMAGDWMPANGPICATEPTQLVGIIFVHDPQMPEVETPHGRLEYLQIFGITQRELDAIMKDRTDTKDILDRHLSHNPLLVTDLGRRD